jgi:hypothetical protein
MPSISAARQIKPQTSTAEGRVELLLYLSARIPGSFIPQVEEKSVAGQALATLTLELLSGKRQIRSQGLRHT